MGEDEAKALLENAYGLKTPEDNVRYYRDFADHYDDGFAEELGYNYAKIVANFFKKNASSTNVPIADIGCGTGLVAAGLSKKSQLVDGFDISAEMLEQARKKNLYRDLIEIDLTQDLTAHHGKYGGVLSAGTFTHGHLGPETLQNLLQIGKKGALFVIGVNAQHYQAHGFADMLQELAANNKISIVGTESVEMYSKRGHDHSGDQALVLIFRKVA